MTTPKKSNLKHLIIGFFLTTASGYWGFSRYANLPDHLQWTDIIAILAFLVGAAILITSTPGEENIYDEKSPF